MRKSPAAFHTNRLEAFDASWVERVLPSGLTVLHVPLPHDDHFFLGVMIRAGSRMEKDHLQGVSHFLEHMMFRGSDRYPEFSRLAEAFEWLGGDWNAARGQEHTEYWYSGIRHTAEDVIDLFAEFLERPRLTDIEVERAIILRELDGETNDHGHSTDMDHHVATMMWPKSTMSQPILGTRDTLAKIQVDDLVRYRDVFYTPQNMAVCAVGGDDSVLDLLSTHFAPLRSQFAHVPRVTYPEFPDFKGPKVKWIEHSDNEYELKLSFLCKGEWSEDSGVYEIITRILSDGFCSRLARRLREQLGLVYDVSAGTALGLHSGTLDISASCSVEQLDQFLTELFQLLRRFAIEGPTEDELQRSIVRAIVDIELSPGVPEAVGAKLAWSKLAGRKLSLVEERERLKQVTVDRVTSVCREIMTPKRTALAAMGPAGKDLEKRMKKALVEGLGD